MGIRVIEQFVESKRSDRVCEDMIVVTDDFAAVIDGASDATGARFGELSGGRFAAEIIAATIPALPASADARLFVDTLAEAVAAEVGELDTGTRWPVAVVTCVSAERRQVWRVGDCNVVIDGAQHPGAMRINNTSVSFRAAVNAAMLEKGTPLDEVIEHDPGAKAARQLIDIQQHLANKIGPWGYGCVNGRRVPDEFIDVLPIPDGASEVILTSDGYPTVLPTLLETEHELSRLIERDPAAIGELWSIGKSTKSGSNAPDDRAYLRIAFE